MINLKTIKVYCITIIIFLLFFLISQKTNSNENKIIFKINNKPFTSLDYSMRLQYLDFVGSNNDLTRELIINDYISANLFILIQKEELNTNLK